MNKKGALELSMNTIIIIVIGVVLLSLGLMFVRGIFGKVQTLSEGAFEEAENVLNTIATHDQEVTVPSQINVKQGDQKTFRIWVVNEKTQSQSYTLSILSQQPGITFLIPSPTVTLDIGGEIGYVVGVSVAKNVAKTQYPFSVGVTGTQIGMKGFFIKVE
jgi:hypothetical protein